MVQRQRAGAVLNEPQSPGLRWHQQLVSPPAVGRITPIAPGGTAAVSNTPDWQRSARNERRSLGGSSHAEVWDANPTSTWDSLDPKVHRALETDSSTAEANFAAWQSGPHGISVCRCGDEAVAGDRWIHITGTNDHRVLLGEKPAPAVAMGRTVSCTGFETAMLR